MARTSLGQWRVLPVLLKKDPSVRPTGPSAHSVSLLTRDAWQYLPPDEQNSPPPVFVLRRSDVPRPDSSAPRRHSRSPRPRWLELHPPSPPTRTCFLPTSHPFRR